MRILAQTSKKIWQFEVCLFVAWLSYKISNLCFLCIMLSGFLGSQNRNILLKHLKWNDHKESPKELYLKLFRKGNCSI